MLNVLITTQKRLFIGYSLEALCLSLPCPFGYGTLQINKGFKQSSGFLLHKKEDNQQLVNVNQPACFFFFSLNKNISFLLQYLSRSSRCHFKFGTKITEQIFLMLIHSFFDVQSKNTQRYNRIDYQHFQTILGAMFDENKTSAHLTPKADKLKRT